MPQDPARQTKAGVVVYRCHPDRPTSVLLVSARQFPGSWVFPVGGVKRGEKAKRAAHRECAEEAGYDVEIGQRLTPFSTQSTQGLIRFKFFLATIRSEVPTQEPDRERRWVPLAHVAEIVPDLFQSTAEEAHKAYRAANSS